MITQKFKTSVSKQSEANALIEILQPFYWKGQFDFDVIHPDKILTIVATENDNHPDIVVDVVKAAGFECIEISEI